MNKDQVISELVEKIEFLSNELVQVKKENAEIKEAFTEVKLENADLKARITELEARMNFSLYPGAESRGILLIKRWYDFTLSKLLRIR